MKYSLCIETMFPQVPIYERPAIAGDCGYDAVEIWDPCQYDVKKLGEAVRAASLQMAACCLYGGHAARVDATWQQFSEKLEKSLLVGEALGCRTFICVTGTQTHQQNDPKILLTENLKRAGEWAFQHNVTLVLEALNSIYDHPGYYLDHASSAMRVIKEIDCPAVKLLYDCYHMQLMEGNLTNTILKNIDKIGHFHAAGVPGRHELHIGEVNYLYLLNKIKTTNYSGYFGMEYWPLEESLLAVQETLAQLKYNKV